MESKYAEQFIGFSGDSFISMRPIGNRCLVDDGWVVGGESGSELAADQVFRRNNGAEPGTLDPHRAEA